MHYSIIRKMMSENTLLMIFRHEIIVEKVPTWLLFIDHVAEILNILFRFRGDLLGSLDLWLGLLYLKQR